MKTKLNSPRTELASLRGMLSNNSKISAPLFSGLDESYFSSDEAVEIYKYIRELSSKDGKVPKYRIVCEDTNLSKNARQFLRDSNASIDSKEEAARTVKILNKYRQIRELVAISRNIEFGFNEKKIDVPKLLEDISLGVSRARSVKSDSNSVIHFGKSSTSYDLLDKLVNEERSELFIPTGLKAFDSVNMGLLRGSLFTIGAASGAGKSVLAASLSESIARIGYKVSIIPLEMTILEMTCRMVAKICHIDSLKVLQGRLTRNEKKLIVNKMYRWEKRAAKLGGRYTIVKPDTDMTIEDAYDSVEQYNPDVCLIDYISLLKEKKGVDQWKQLGQDARYSKINADNRNRVNVLICQVDNEGKVRYSRAVTEHSSSSWICTVDKDEGIMNVSQRKGRNQDDRPMVFRIEHKYSSVTDIDGWDDDSPKKYDDKAVNLAQED